MAAETLAEYNVLFKNSQRTVSGDVLALMNRASLIGLNEGARGAPAAGIRDAVKRKGWKSYYSGESDWMLWDPAVWRLKGKPGKAVICESARALGWHVKYHPARLMIWARLEHKKSGAVHYLHVTHLPQAYSKPVRQQKSPRLNALVDKQARQATIKVDQITRMHIKRTPQDFHHLIGDMNSRQTNEQEPWYPSAVWDGTWVPDTLPNSIDWMMHSVVAKKNGLRVLRRYTLGRAAGYDSDHRAGIKRVHW